MRVALVLFVTICLLPAMANAYVPAISKTDVDVHIDGRIATTKVLQVLRNDSLRRTEAHFRLHLPVGATITRLAMSVKDELVEGEVVPRSRAREIYDGIVRAQQDPALLEWQAPGEYTLEIFPIEPRENKRVIVEYTELLGVDKGFAEYRFQPFASSSAVEHFEIDIESKTPLTVPEQPEQNPPRRRFSLQTRAIAPDPVAVLVRADRNTVWTGDRRFVADVRLELPRETAAARHVVVAVDRSASVASLSRARRVASLLAAQPHREFRIVHGSTQTVRCPSPTKVDSCFATIERRGATDLSALVRLAAAEASSLGGATDIVLITDGRQTHGAPRAADVAAPVLDIIDTALHVVPVGDEAKIGWLAELALRGRGTSIDAEVDVDGALLDARETPRLWSVRTSENMFLDRDWVGGNAGVTAFGSGDLGAVKLVLQRAGRERTIVVEPSRAASNSYVDALWAGFRLQRLHRRGEEAAMERFSVKHGVLSTATSYLVLEDAAAFRQHGVERREHRRKRAQHEAHKARRPAIAASAVVVSGSLDTQLISRAIRTRLSAIRSCYEDALLTDPSLTGYVAVEFEFEHGRIRHVRVRNDDLDSGPLTDCILNEFRTLRFPIPTGGGLVTVRYPFHFTTPNPRPRTGPTATSAQVAALLRQGERARAGALLERALAQYSESSEVNAALRLRLFSAQSVRDTYPARFIEAGIERLNHPTPPRGLLTTITLRLLDERRARDLLRLPAPPHRLMRWMLGQAIHRVSVPELRMLYAHWADGASAADRLDAIIGEPVLEVALASDVVVATLAAQPPDAAALDAMARVATITPWKKQAARFIVERCAAEPPSAACLTRLRLLRGIAGVPNALRRQHARRLTELEQLRLRNRDPDVLAELSELLAELGEYERAVDIAWEIVELRPDSESSRERAFQLVQSFPPPR